MHIYVDCKQGFTTNSMLHILFHFLNKKQKKIFFEKFSKINNKHIKIKIARKKIGKKILGKMDVISNDSMNIRSFSDVKYLIKSFKTSKKIKKMAYTVFFHLAKVEAIIHKEKIANVHFHEIGHLSNIAKILMISWLLDRLKIKKIYFGKINVGSGKIKTSHGLLSVPAPATKRMLRDFKIFSKGNGELVTPSSAAILKVFGKQMLIR